MSRDFRMRVPRRVSSTERGQLQAPVLAIPQMAAEEIQHAKTVARLTHAKVRIG